MRVILALFTVIFSVTVSAQSQELSWQEANRQSAALFDDGDLEKAAPLARQAAELYPLQSTAYKAENHVQLVWNAAEMTLHAEGQQKAALFLEKVIEDIAEKAGENEILIAPLAAEAAQMFGKIGELGKSHRLYRQACSLADEVLGETDPRSILYYMNWGQDLRLKYGVDWARVKLRTARKRAEVHGEDNFLVLRADLLLAKLRLEKDDKRLAVREYQDLVDRLEKRDEEDPVLLQSSYAHLAYIYAEIEDEDALNAVMRKFGQSFSGNKDEVLPLIRVQPVYPPNAARRHQEGYVIVDYTIDELGRVKDARISDRQGDEVFDRAALDAVNKWRYRPLLVGGVAQSVEGMQTQLTFKIK